MLSLALLLSGSGATPLEKIGHSIHLPFPNDQSILGVGGLSYSNEDNMDLWTACSENVAFAHDDENKDAAVSWTRHKTL